MYSPHTLRRAVYVFCSVGPTIIKPTLTQCITIITTKCYAINVDLVDDMYVTKAAKFEIRQQVHLLGYKFKIGLLFGISIS